MLENSTGHLHRHVSDEKQKKGFAIFYVDEFSEIFLHLLSGSPYTGAKVGLAEPEIF